MPFYDSDFTLPPPKQYDNHDVHVIAQLEYRLEQERMMRNHFETLARDREKDLASVRETARRNLAEAHKFAEATGGVVPTYQRQGNFTICVLVDPISERVFTGATCCGRDDTFNETIGQAISLGRAMASRADYYAAAAYGR